MLYLQICIIGLAILTIPLLNRRSGYRRDWQLFRAVVVTVMLDIVLETCGWMLDGCTFMGAGAIIYAVNLFTILLQPTMGLLWLYYTFEELDIKLKKGSWLHLLCFTPFAVNVLLLLTNHWTGLAFVIDESNVYARGELFWIDVVISFLYPASTTVIALVTAARAKSYAKRHDCYIIASFILPPVIAAILQLMIYGAFLFLIGFAIALLIVYINIQNEQITLDFLTRVNNRASFIAYYDRKIHSLKPGRSLYLYMIDIDFFKTINDNYGHIVGDKVLTAVADELKNTCSGQRCFLARLGGDEFGILYDCTGADEAAAFAKSIQHCLDEFNADSNLSSPVTLSIGYAASDGEDCTVDHLILQADGAMYIEKAEHHKNSPDKRRRR